MKRQRETFIYHHVCVEAKLIPAELQESQKKESWSKEAMLKEGWLQKLDCLCVNKGKGQDKTWPMNFFS